MLHRTTFTVTGVLTFPIDMLRYDGCYPNRGEDAGSIEYTFDPHRKRIQVSVQLAKWHQGKEPNITYDRWASFSWAIDRGTINTLRT